MREGLAKSLVLDFPKYQIIADGKSSFPWVSLDSKLLLNYMILLYKLLYPYFQNHIFEKGTGRGWIANAARAIQSKHRTRQSKQKEQSSSENDSIPPDSNAVCPLKLIENSTFYYFVLY